MTIPIEDGTAAGVLDVRHHYFEFIPEEQGDRRPARDCRSDRPDRRAKLFHRADDGRRTLSLQHFRPGPLRRLSWPGSADRVPQQGGSLLKPYWRKAFRTPGDRRCRGGPATVGVHLRSYLADCRRGMILPYYSLLVEESDLTSPAIQRTAGQLPSSMELGPERRVCQQA